MDFIIISGMSGAGKSTAMKALEDVGYFCVDNVPPVMLIKFAELNQSSTGYGDKMAIGVDTRSFREYYEFASCLEELTKNGVKYRMIFIDANNTVLLNRYKENRRSHPLLMSGDNTMLEDAISNERMILEPIRNSTEYLVDSSAMSVRQLKEHISDIVLTVGESSLEVQCMSFGFKYGLPIEADIVYDVRCLPNPFYIPELKLKTGLDKEVSDYVLDSDVSRSLLAKLVDIIDFSYPLYEKEGKSRLVIAMGCTGGQHRSVTFAQAIAEHLEQKGVRAGIYHRDMEKNQHKLIG